MHPDVRPDKRTRNVNISLLKMSLAFLVVFIHYGHTSHTWLRYLTTLAVPAFMWISFYLSGRYFYERRHPLRHRLWRLLVPFWGWGVVYSLAAFCTTGAVDFATIFSQLVFGGSLCPPLYFIFIQVVISIVFWLILALLPKSRAEGLLIGIGIAAYTSQYSGINFTLFSDLPFDLKYPLGRIVELIPMAVTGILCSQRISGSAARSTRIKLQLLCAAFVFVGFLVRGHAPGFGYSGIDKLFCSTAFCLLFLSLRLPGLLIWRIVDYLSPLSLGIYCTHLLVGRLVVQVMPIASIFRVASIFVFALLFSMLLSHLPGIRKMVV